MDTATRRYFDEQLEAVLPTLPQMVHDALNDIPLLVEDYPPASLLKEFDVDDREELQGLYTGSTRFADGSEDFPDLPESIYLFREGILALAVDENGKLDEAELREQIRVTLMHEVGHYYGLDEADLEKHGYD